jgi:hypothetical protein
METLTAGRHPEGLIAPLLNEDWETVLTVILHSPHYTKSVDPIEGLPLHVAIEEGAPAKVVTALLEAYPDATSFRNYYNALPCHSACYAGISSEGMRMLLRCNPDAANVITDYGRTPIQCLNVRAWKFFCRRERASDERSEATPFLLEEQRAAGPAPVRLLGD